MLPNLTANEARVVGCLMEKSVVTPDQYPLTLNALTSACNQKSARDPVMSLEPGMVQRAARDLAEKNFAREDESFRSGVAKYHQRFCNSAFSDYQFDPAQFAIVCLLLLRGPQTPGELRARSGRLHAFVDNSAVVEAATGLIEREGDALLVQLPRTPGRKDAEFMHLFCGQVDVAEHSTKVQAAKVPAASERATVAELEQRVSKLEAEVAELKEHLKTSQ
ncbi:MAG: YceH family protein [Pseudomonadales bacterium]